jgi:hypothetical protein
MMKSQKKQVFVDHTSKQGYKPPAWAAFLFVQSQATATGVAPPNSKADCAAQSSA